MKKLSRISSVIASVPWAIEPRALDMIEAIVARHLGGDPIPDIEPRPAAPSVKGIAVIPIMGPIVPRASLMANLSGATSSEEISGAIKAASEHPDVSAILLDIDSPGGSVLGGFEAADALFAARGKKPMAASVNGCCASLAYLFASQADMVFASRGSQVGSIGVIARHYDDSRATGNEGVDAITVASSREKAMSGMTKEEITAKLRAEVDHYFGMFKEAVARGRKKMDMDAVATGEMWLADRAHSIGLIDGIATREEVISDMLKLYS